MSTTSRSLATYRRKRDFGRTAEPAGARGRGPAREDEHPRFVVQEHSASAMHWDLRLEHDGVLLSWAVPKGIPEAPGENRLAVRTEDHPLEYLDFEGEIPRGNYGAGRMRIWDSGTYEPEELRVEDGKVHVRLEGARTRGRYVLVRTGGDVREGTKEQWLLRRLDPPQDPDREPLPEHVRPMLAKLGALPRDPANWAFEVKWDGIRAIVFGEGGRVRIETRNLNDVTAQYPELHRLGRALGSHAAVIDGEIVAYDERGRPSFQELQARLGLSSPSSIRARAAQVPVQYVAFDLLHLDGHDITSLPYEDRRRLLRELLDDAPNWRVPEHHVGAGEELLDAVVAQGLEGVVAKRLGSPYRQGKRGGEWIKAKRQRRQEFVICGWAEGTGRRAGGIGSLLLGVHDDGRLVHVGSVGTGFDDAELQDLRARFEQLAVDRPPYDDGAPGSVAQPGKWKAIRARSAGPVAVHYVEPALVCEVEFTEWTSDGILRHPSYQGLRFDKDPREVVREEEVEP